MPHGYPLPKVHQYFDNNGDNAAFYLLYTYAAGTSTPKATYQDSALTIENTNPIVLDDYGRCTIFVCGGEGYKLTFFDTVGNLIWTRDNWSVPAEAEAVIPAEVPIGGIVGWGGAAAPDNWLLCDGQEVDRTTYAGLFAVMSTTFGVGDGSTTFALPDLRGRFPMGVAASGTGSTLGATAGAIDHVHAGPSHTHPVASHTHVMTHTHTVPRDGWGGEINEPPTAGRLQSGGSGVGAEASTMQATMDNTTGAASASVTGGTALTTDADGTDDTGTANPPLLAIHFIVRAA